MNLFKKLFYKKLSVADVLGAKVEARLWGKRRAGIVTYVPELDDEGDPTTVPTWVKVKIEGSFNSWEICDTNAVKVICANPTLNKHRLSSARASSGRSFPGRG